MTEITGGGWTVYDARRGCNLSDVRSVNTLTGEVVRLARDLHGRYVVAGDDVLTYTEVHSVVVDRVARRITLNPALPRSWLGWPA